MKVLATVLLPVIACGLLLGQPAVASPPKGNSIVVKLKHQETFHTVRLGSHEDTGALLQRLNADPVVDYAGENRTYELAVVPGDTYYQNQWYLEKVNAPQAWDTTTGDDGIVIAVLDTGIDLDHPDLQQNIWHNTDEIPNNSIDDDANGYVDDYYGWDFVGDQNDPQPQFSGSWTAAAVHHGSVVAGIAGAKGNNNKGITGMNWTVRMMSVRVLNDAGMGDTGDIAAGVRYAMRNGADIINLSFVGNETDTVLAQIINEATAAGVMIFAAAGNNNINLDQQPRYPVCNDNVIGVGGTDQNDARFKTYANSQISNASNYGDTCVDIAAPATSYLSTIVYAPDQSLESYYASGWSGTSLATPVVAGSAALIKAHNPLLTNAQIEQMLKSHAAAVSEAGLGAGRINIGAVFGNLIPASENIVVGAGYTGGPHVRQFDLYGELQSHFFAYGEQFRGGVYVASGDTDGNGFHEIITGAGDTGGPQVRLFRTNGEVISQFFAYGESFRGGVHVAAGDVDGDGIDEIITGAGNGGGPQVRVFKQDGSVISQFFAYAETFRGGVHVAAGDVDGDGIDEIITGAGNGGGPHIRVFDIYGNEQTELFAYAETFRGGVNVAAGDLDGDGTAEIIAGAGFTGGPHVRVFNYQGQLQSHFFAYAETFRGGVNVAAGDLDGDGTAEIIAGAGFTGGPHVRVFNYQGQLQSHFFAYAETFRGGVNVATIR